MDPQLFQQLNTNAEANFATRQQAQPKAAPHPNTPGGLKGFLINALPSIAGGAGLVGGEILDPFGGGLLAGSAAAGAGEALKQKLLGQSISPKQVAIQAGETAALGGIGKALGGVKTASQTLLGTKAAPIASEAAATEAAPGAVQAAQAASAAPSPTLGQKITSGLINKGQQIEAKLGGYAPGQKVAGQQLNTAASDKIAQTLQNEGITALGAPERLAQVGQKLDTYNQARTSLMQAHDAPLSTADKATIQDAFRTRLASEAGGTSTNVQNHAGTFLNEVLQKNNISDLGAYKTSLDNNAINWTKNPASTEPGQMIAAKAMRGTIKNFVEQKVPGIADVNAKATALNQAQGALMNASGRLANLSTGGEGLWGRALSGATAEKGKALAARGMQVAGKAAGGEVAPIAGNVPPLAIAGDTGVPAERGLAQEGAQKIAGAAGEPPPPPSDLISQAATQIKNAPGNLVRGVAGRTVAPVLAKPGATAGKVVKQLAGRAVGNAAMGAGQPQQPGQSAQDITQLEQQASQDASQAQSQSQYPQENMLYDIEKDPAHASTYEALYKVMNPASKPTAAAQNAVLNAEDTQSQLNAYQTALSGAGGSKGGILGTITKLAGESKLINTPQAGSAAAVNQARNDLGAQLAKLVTGGSRPPEAVTQHYTDLIPTTTDTPAAAQAKFQYINSLIGDMKKNAQGSSGASAASSLTDALSAAGLQ